MIWSNIIFLGFDNYFKLEFLKERKPSAYSTSEYWLVDQILKSEMVNEEFKRGPQKVMVKFIQGIYHGESLALG
jgi:hypothetical protein